MNQLQLNGIIRSILVAVGSYLIGKTIFGTTITDGFWQDFIGIALSLAGIIWSVIDKSIALEAVQGVLRQVITFAGGIMVASGKVNGEVVVMLVGLIPVIAPPIYAFLSRLKTYKLHTGEIRLSQLNK